MWKSKFFMIFQKAYFLNRLTQQKNSCWYRIRDSSDISHRSQQENPEYQSKHSHYLPILLELRYRLSQRLSCNTSRLFPSTGRSNINKQSTPEDYNRSGIPSAYNLPRDKKKPSLELPSWIRHQRPEDVTLLVLLLHLSSSARRKTLYDAAITVTMKINIYMQNRK